MRTNDERITALYRRAAQLDHERKNRSFILVCTLSAAVCIAVLVGIASLIPRAAENAFDSTAVEGMNASIFAGSSILGYIVIAILAFILGITVTVFCFLLKKRKDEKDRENFR